jgi:arylsulfatase A-like enzyme
VIQSKRVDVLATSLAVAAIVLANAHMAVSEIVRPNVLVILTDDQGWGDLSLNGNQNLHTPHVDTLAREGASFDRFFVCPVCSPTRAEFLTGRYHPRLGVYSTSAGGERLNLDETTIADTFQAAGYATAAFGKWHNGMQYPYHPNGRGFDEFYGFCSGHWGNYFDPPLDHNGRIVRGVGFLIDDFTNRALAFIERNRDRPFFVYLPLNTPHSPMQVPDRWWEKFKDKSLGQRHRDPDRENVAHTRAALAMCENIDWNVGRLLTRLSELGLDQNTIVVYFCDNGPNGYRWNGDMKGRKGSTDEGGVRSPLLVRWPAKIRPDTRVAPISAAIDLFPTLTDMAEIPITATKPLDGRSLKPLLFGQRVDWSDREIYSHWNGRVSVRTQQFRLDHQGHLFDMLRDPGQRVDVASQHPDVARRLTASTKSWRDELLAELGKDPRPFLIGHERYVYTQLPARDGKPHGNIRRSNRFPNCSYFTNWTDAESDRMTWNVQVAAGGMYDVEVYYTCPQQDVGSIVELRLNESRLRATIGPAHDPPVGGHEHDRVKRGESYVKDFKPLKLGTMQLEAGKGELVLKALSVAGSSVMDVRLLMFTKLAAK